MSVHYRVTTRYRLSGTSPVLSGLELHSTAAVCTNVPWVVGGSMLHFYQVFPSLDMAYSYIDHLYHTHRYIETPHPIANADQLLLF